MAEEVGTAEITINEDTYSQVQVYRYGKYLSVFNPTDRPMRKLPKSAKVVFEDERYTAVKYGNPDNRNPTYDFMAKVVR